MAATTTRPRLDRRTRSARARGRDAREDLFDAAIEVVAERGFKDASVGEIAARAGLSKGALYWHFASKDDLFFALLEERVDSVFLEMVELLSTAPAEQDMAPEASRRFVDVLRRQRPLLLIDNEYWSMAVRDPRLRRRYASRQAKLRKAIGQALRARSQQLGGPDLGERAKDLATVIMGLTVGLGQERLISPAAVSDELLGETIVLIYRGLAARDG